MKTCIVFDWDGTLHNTKKLYADSVRRACAFLAGEKAADPEAFSDEKLSDENLSKYLGMTARDMWKEFMPGLAEPLRAKAEQIVGDSMVELVREGKAVLYDGVPEVLDALKEAGYELVILSNCKVAYLEAHRNCFGLDRWFTGYYPAQKYDFIPKEEIMKLVMEEHPGRHVVVGDRYHDLDAGKKNHLPVIGCAYGFAEPDELADADVILSDIRELPQAMLTCTRLV